jgi:hypothetical protein
MVNAGIQAAIAAKLREAAMDADETLARLSEIASIDLGDFLTIAQDGSYTLDLAKAEAAGKLHLIKKLTPTRYGIVIELHDALAALTLLGKYHGLFIDRQEISGRNGSPLVITDDVRVRANEEIDQWRREQIARFVGEDQERKGRIAQSFEAWRHGTSNGTSATG